MKGPLPDPMTVGLPGIVITFQHGVIWLRMGEQSMALDERQCLTLAAALAIGAQLVADVTPEHSC